MTLADAFVHLFTLKPFLIMVAGVALGVSVGVLPGITAGMLMALTLPFTYHMSSIDAVSLLIAMFVGGVSGGLITATLMRIPGEPNAIMTCLDGYQLARRGQPGRALGLGNSSSLVGGTLSWAALVLLAPPLASIAVAFGPFENFAVIMLALILISSLSEGSFLKGLSAGLLGMLVSYPGIDESSGIMRLTFGFTALEGGFNSLPVILGMFAVSQVVADALNIEANASAIKATMRGMFVSLRDYVVHGWNMLRSSLIGIWIGILPGVGATVASIVAYTTAKNLSRNPEAFGTGSEEAIVAAESANNATTGGTLVPILTLGISGGLTNSILLGALVIHNLQPGPLLYKNNPEIVNTIFATHLVAHLVDVRADDVRHRVLRAPHGRAARLHPADGDGLLGARGVRPQQPLVRYLGDAGLRAARRPARARQGAARPVRRRPGAGAGGGVGAARRTHGVGGQLHAADRAPGRLHDARPVGRALRVALRAGVAQVGAGAAPTESRA